MSHKKIDDSSLFKIDTATKFLLVSAVLLLTANLTLYATMSTSAQEEFSIDNNATAEFEEGSDEEEAEIQKLEDEIDREEKEDDN